MSLRIIRYLAEKGYKVTIRKVEYAGTYRASVTKPNTLYGNHVGEIGSTHNDKIMEKSLSLAMMSCLESTVCENA